MRFDEVFEVAAGSVAGRSHVLASRPNQDSSMLLSFAPGFVGLVCDGCGSGEHNEIGAAIGARIVAEQVRIEIEAGAAIDEETTWERIRERTLAAMDSLARAMGVDARGIGAFFLFTVLGIAITERRAVLFGIGDGVFAVNGAVKELGPFPGNAPPYLGYGLCGGGPKFSMYRAIDTKDLDSALVGTDGAVDLDSLAGKPRPGGRGEVVPALKEFWTDDRYFRNEDAIRRTLSLINRDVTRPLWTEKRLEKDPGLLEDDTTLVVVRRKKSGG